MNDWNIHGISIEKMNPIGGIIIDDWWLILKKEHLDMFEWLFWKTSTDDWSFKNDLSFIW